MPIRSFVDVRDLRKREQAARGKGEMSRRWGEDMEEWEREKSKVGREDVKGKRERLGEVRKWDEGGWREMGQKDEKMIGE